GNFVIVPGNQVVLLMAGLPFVPAVRRSMEFAGPVALGDISGTRETEHVALSEKSGQCGMDRPAPLAVAPARHDKGTGNNPGALRARPPHRVEKLIGTIGTPVRDNQPRLP